jgi:hypothetical protein
VGKHGFDFPLQGVVATAGRGEELEPASGIGLVEGIAHHLLDPLPLLGRHFQFLLMILIMLMIFFGRTDS